MASLREEIFTVSQVALHLRELLESSSFLGDLWIVGEVSNLRVSSTGHSYFTLKDGGAALNCVLFRGQSGASALENGKSVRCHGRMSFYEPRGSTDFMVDRALPEGEGELAMELERLKARLERQGLFAESRKRPLPPFPRVIGVVTSPTGAVWQDIQNVVRRRYPLAALLLAPAQVQGLNAGPTLAAALEKLSQPVAAATPDGGPEVIILARGGGSLEDLWPFNEEAVAWAIFGSRVPVISGVGHETDFTIADYVADCRAATPSAAAELATPDQTMLRETLDAWAERAYRGVRQSIGNHRNRTDNIGRRLELGRPDLSVLKRRVDDLAEAAKGRLKNRLHLARLEINGMEDRLRVLDPAATLKRGFSVVQRSDTGQVVTNAGQALDGAALTITLAQGTLLATAGVPSKANETADPNLLPANQEANPAPPDPLTANEFAVAQDTSSVGPEAPEAQPRRARRRRKTREVSPGMDKLL